MSTKERNRHTKRRWEQTFCESAYKEASYNWAHWTETTETMKMEREKKKTQNVSIWIKIVRLDEQNV